ncbi:MAG: multidrug/biocide efflux PACE transporter [Pseudomonadota bacterium]|nr:multidrug/biocide efflux PACE transporter [Pseudomonadota bacterium]
MSNVSMQTVEQAQVADSLQRSLKERVFHALCYEVFGIIIFTPIAAWFLGFSLLHTGILTAAISAIAMLWNMLFNWLFDGWAARMNWARTVKIRVLHALLFEGGLVIAIVPLAAWWLDVSLWHAFWLDIGFLLAFLPYTYAFNWTYDHLRARLLSGR